MSTGRLITFEGVDGSGKSTQAQMLLERMKSEGKDCALYREPGGTELGEAVRKILLETRHSDGLGSVTEMLLFATARAELVRQVIRPALDRGATIILDRFTDSTVAYQGYGRGVALDFIESVNAGATGGLKPDLTFLFDIEPNLALSRIARSHDRMEAEGLEFMARVREGYLSIAEKERHRFIVFCGEISIPDTAAEIARWV